MFVTVGEDVLLFFVGEGVVLLLWEMMCFTMGEAVLLLWERSLCCHCGTGTCVVTMGTGLL